MTDISANTKVLVCAGFVHRNVKASNIIWMGTSSTWTLTDFGNAFEMGGTAPLNLSLLALRSSPPEVAKLAATGVDTFPVSGAIDAWALGLLGFRLMTGHDLFPEDMSSLTIMSILEGRLSLPWEANTVSFTTFSE